MLLGQRQDVEEDSGNEYTDMIKIHCCIKKKKAKTESPERKQVLTQELYKLSKPAPESKPTKENKGLVQSSQKLLSDTTKQSIKSTALLLQSCHSQSPTSNQNKTAASQDFLHLHSGNSMGVRDFPNWLKQTFQNTSGCSLPSLLSQAGGSSIPAMPTTLSWYTQ